MSLQAGYNLVGSQFLNIGQVEQSCAEFVAAGNTLPGITDDGDFQTTLQVWTGRGYTIYGWSDADDGDAIDWAESNSQWLDQKQEEIIDIEMPVGQGYWIETTEPATVTFAGEVLTGDTKTISLVPGYNLIANPFPETMSIQSVQSTDLPGITDDGDFQVTLEVWTGRGYTIYGWSDADDGDAIDWSESNSKWLDQKQENIVDANIAVGQGFWINTPSAATVTFTK